MAMHLGAALVSRDPMALTTYATSCLDRCASHNNSAQTLGHVLASKLVVLVELLSGGLDVLNFLNPQVLHDRLLLGRIIEECLDL